jgi:hypothetical protein
MRKFPTKLKTPKPIIDPLTGDFSTTRRRNTACVKAKISRAQSLDVITSIKTLKTYDRQNSKNTDGYTST